MNNLNIGVLVSSILAATGLGVYVYMNNNDEPSEPVNNEISENDEQDEEENDKYMKSHKKSVTIKTKRRSNKQTGTRRKR
jgi:hypothetical protein